MLSCTEALDQLVMCTYDRDLALFISWSLNEAIPSLSTVLSTYENLESDTT